MIQGDNQLKDKLAAVAVFVIDRLGLHKPSEKTAVSIVGVVLAAHGKPMSFHAAHDHLRTFKRLIRERRMLGSSASSVLTYPQSAFAFVSRNPGRYSQDDPPVTCPLAHTVIASGRSLVCRRLDDHVLYGESLADRNSGRDLQAMPDYRPIRYQYTQSKWQSGIRFPVIVPRPRGNDMREEDVVYWARVNSPTAHRSECTEAVMEGARRIDDRTSRSPYRSSRSSEATSENADPEPQ